MLLSALAALQPAHAGTGSGTLTAQTAVNTNCTISATAIAFGNYNPIGTHATADLNASGAITIRCVKGTAPSIALGPGSHPSGSTRRMFDAAANDYLVYEIYRPANNIPLAACSYAAAAVWGANGATIFFPSSAPSAAARTYNVCGTVPKAQNPSIGSNYADTVIATVNF